MTVNKKQKPVKKEKQSKARKEKKGSTSIDSPKDNVANDVHLTREYEIYAVWKQLPPMLKGTTPRDLEEKYFMDDEDLIQLLQIRTQTAFAEKFNLNPATLYRWNLRLKDRDIFKDIRAWSTPLTKNVVMSTYRASVMKDPKANADRKLFLNLTGHNDEITVHNKGETLTELFKRGLGIE